MHSDASAQPQLFGSDIVALCKDDLEDIETFELWWKEHFKPHMLDEVECQLFMEVAATLISLKVALTSTTKKFLPSYSRTSTSRQAYIIAINGLSQESARRLRLNVLLKHPITQKLVLLPSSLCF